MGIIALRPDAFGSKRKSLPPHLNQPAKRILQIDAASNTPLQKLGDVHSAFSDLALMHPRLGLAKLPSEIRCIENVQSSPTGELA